MEPTSRENDKHPVRGKWYQSQPRGTMMGTVRGTYTKHLHCGVRTKGGVHAGAGSPWVRERTSMEAGRVISP
ncbi:hypothetical protein ACSBR1_023480 [Camellia fascicularis]